MHPLPAAEGRRGASQGDHHPAHAADAELDLEISAADMDVIDAMRDTDKHEDAPEFRWS